MKNLPAWIVTAFLLTHMLHANVIAIVNGEKVTTEVAPKSFKTLPKETQKKITERLVQKRLAIQYALSTDIVKSEAFQKTLSHVIGYAKPSSSETKTLADAMKKPGYTKEQERSKKGLLAFDFILDKKAKEMQPKEEELRAYYEARKYQYDTPEMVELSTIVTDTEEEAKKLLGLIDEKPKDFNHFSDIARKDSKGPDAKDGGYLGKIPVSDLNPTIKKEIMALQRGEHTPPLKTEFGYQIYYLINHIPEVKTDFEMVKDHVKEAYVQEKVKEWAYETIRSLRKKAKVSYP